jgi:hypothetical protein
MNPEDLEPKSYSLYRPYWTSHTAVVILHPPYLIIVGFSNTSPVEVALNKLEINK